MPFLRLIFDVGRVYCYSTRLFFWSLVDLRIIDKGGAASLCKSFGDGRGESGFPVVDMT